MQCKIHHSTLNSILIECKCQVPDPENRAYKIFYTNRLTLIRKYNKVVKGPFKLKSFEKIS